MIFRIDPASSRPVYQQFIDQVKYAVASGRLREGDRLSTIREVAAETRINRNTVARAYADLEREGVIYTRAGQGAFVAGGNSGVHRARAKQLLAEQIDQMLAQAHQFRFSPEDITQLVEERQRKLNR